MPEDFYDLLKISKNATDYEIYRSFLKLIGDADVFDELTKKNILMLS